MAEPSLAALRTAQYARTAPSRGTGSDLTQLLARVEQQNMVIQTLLILLVEKNVINETEFGEWMRYVDGLDGRMDGKLAPDARPVLCPGCRRNNPPHATRCQYCNKTFSAEVLDRRHAR